MSATPSSAPSIEANQGPGLRQWIKIVVYTLLLVNWGFYIYDDWTIARHTLHEGSTWLDISSAFAVSIDEMAWFILLFLFELETYALPDESFTRRRVMAMHSVRLICYLFLAHTVFAYANAGLDLQDAKRVSPDNGLCHFVDEGLSYGNNLDYTELDALNCQSLSADSDFFLIEDGEVVTDTNGLRIENELVWIDLAEACVWLLILFIIEIIVRLQERDITRGRLMTSLKSAKVVLYSLLWGAAAYWIYRGHYIYAWDEALWILGFMAIGMNLKEWRQEIEEEAAAQ